MLHRSVFVSFIFLLISSNNSAGQSLIQNGGFEQLSSCPSAPGDINLSIPWNAAGGSSDLFAFCYVNPGSPGCNDVGVPINFAGNAQAHSGSCYAGIISYRSTSVSRSYLQIPISQTLTKDSLYRVNAWIRRSSGSKFATNSLGFAFSTAPLNQSGSSPILVPPQLEITQVLADTSNWFLYEDYYVATGIESYLTIGNFRDDPSTNFVNFGVAPNNCVTMNELAYYYVDDISLQKVTESLSISGDTLLCTGESTTLIGFSTTQGYWSTQALPTDTLANGNNVLSITPANTTAYLWHGLGNTIPVTVYVNPPPSFSLGADTTVCSNDTIPLSVNLAGVNYLWSTGSTASSIDATAPGIYILTVSLKGCEVRDTITISDKPVPPIVLNQDTTVCKGVKEVTLDAGIASTYLWYPGGESTQLITVTDPGIYSVQTVLANGCDNSASVRIAELCEDLLFVPGAFTPNGDGKNDVFYAQGTGIFDLNIAIFNRWGQQVFESSAITVPWDGTFNGKDCPSGNYSYIIKYTGNGPGNKPKPKTTYGTFILFR